MWVFLLVSIGRIGELVPLLSGLPLAKIALGLALIVLITKWNTLPATTAFSLSLARTCAALVVLVILSIPFSVWLRPSVTFFYRELPTMILTVVLICRLSYDWRSVRSLILALVVSGAALAVVTLVGFSGGRAGVDTMYDQNDLAYVLVTAFPLALAFFFVSTTAKKRLLFLGIAAGMVTATLLTASRGGFVALIAASLVIVLDTGKLNTRNSGKRLRKVVLASLIFGCIAAAAWPLLPVEHQQRLSSILNLEQDYNFDPNNDRGRSQIWERGLSAVAERPLGYGIAAHQMVDLRFGGRGQAAHNSFIQIAIELGVLGAILLLRVYWLCFFGLGKARKALATTTNRTPGQEEQSVFFRMLQASLVGNLVAGAFLTMAYASTLWTIVALVMGCLALSPTVRQGPVARRGSGPGATSVT
jgi:O-antigen ligase